MNSCHRIPNSSRIFYKQDMCRKHSKNPSCRYENKGSNFPHLIWSQNSHIKFFGGLLFDFKYSVFEQLRPNSTIRYSVFVHFQKPNNSVFGIRKIFKNRIIRYSVFGPYSLFGPTLILMLWAQSRPPPLKLHQEAPHYLGKYWSPNVLH